MFFKKYPNTIKAMICFAVALLILVATAYAQSNPGTDIVEQWMKNTKPPTTYSWTQQDTNDLVQDLEQRIITLEQKVKFLETQH